MNVAVLAHEKFPDDAKTAVGILRYAEYDVRAIIDRETAGGRVSEFVNTGQDAPIVAAMHEAPSVDALVIGIAPIGGGFDESWRPDIVTALERGNDVISGLHYFLNDDAEFTAMAAENGCELWDVRQPPDGLTVSRGVAADVSAEVVLTVGTDCSSGKMTTTMELAERAREWGVDVGVIPTGQTGIMIENYGIAIDRVISDFAAGAVEHMICERGEEYDLLVVEGQGTIIHPAYSGVTCAILHGAMADHLVLCHVAGRQRLHGYENTPIPAVERYVDLYESLAEPVHQSRVVAGAVGTHSIENEEMAREAVQDYSASIGVPATDPVRFGADEILETVL